VTFVGGIFGQRLDAGKILLLLHCDGTNGSTTFTDSSSYAHSMSIAAGSPTISTAQSKFGGASIYGNTGDCRIFTTLDADADGVENWTIAGWFRRAASETYVALGYWNGGNNVLELMGGGYDNSYKLRYTGLGGEVMTSTTAFALDTWTHFEVSAKKVGATTTWYMFIDGDLEDSTTSGGDTLHDGAFEIGRQSSAGFSGMNGYLDEYLIYMDCLHTSSFTPPTAPYA
jgi:hypothetical protein